MTFLAYNYVRIFIITDSNGAGNSSIGPEYSPAHIQQQGPSFDGDKLFGEKRKELWRSIKSHKECSKLAYAFVTETFDYLADTALTGNLKLAYEGHFTNEATWIFLGNFDHLAILFI